MKRLALILTAGFLFVFFVPTNAQAQSLKLGPRATVSLGDISDVGGDFGIGANARVGIPGVPVDGDGAFTYYFADDPFTVWTLDLNALYPLPLANPAFEPYVGGGIGITGLSNGSSDTDTALNLVGGIEFSAGGLSPFVEANLGVGGDIDRFGITGGLLYGF